MPLFPNWCANVGCECANPGPEGPVGPQGPAGPTNLFIASTAIVDGGVGQSGVGTHSVSHTFDVGSSVFLSGGVYLTNGNMKLDNDSVAGLTIDEVKLTSINLDRMKLDLTYTLTTEENMPGGIEAWVVYWVPTA